MERTGGLTDQRATHRVVTFFLGEEQCALPITDVHQIIRRTPITPVPNVGQCVEGLLNARGMVIPVVDLKKRLGLGPCVRKDSYRILIVEVGERRVGFSVELVGGVLHFEEDELQPPPEVVLAKVGGRFVRGVVRRGESIVALLDLAKVVQRPSEESDQLSDSTEAQAAGSNSIVHAG